MLENVGAGSTAQTVAGTAATMSRMHESGLSITCLRHSRFSGLVFMVTFGDEVAKALFGDMTPSRIRTQYVRAWMDVSKTKVFIQATSAEDDRGRKVGGYNSRFRPYRCMFSLHALAGVESIPAFEMSECTWESRYSMGTREIMILLNTRRPAEHYATKRAIKASRTRRAKSGKDPAPVMRDEPIGTIKSPAGDLDQVVAAIRTINNAARTGARLAITGNRLSVVMTTEITG